ncbi:hypothetical protein ACQJBY_011724 [Aegilops geniculata]
MMNASRVFSGEAEGETGDKSSGTADPKNASGEGNGVAAYKFSSLPEYPRVARLRQRRLMGYLWSQGFDDSYNELMNKTRAYMDLPHLRGLIEAGRWADAVEYVNRFLPPATPCHKSFYAIVFRHFLKMLHGFADAAAGKGEKLLPKHYLQLNHKRSVSHAELRLRSICMSVIDRFRANMNWQRMQIKASSIVYTLAHRVPELRGCFSLPTTGFNPRHVLPIASGLGSRRRYVKQKNTGSEKQKAVIRALKRSLKRRHMSSKIESVDEAKELLADLLDETVRSGFQTLSSDPSHPLENEGAQFLQPIPGTFTEAKTSGPSTNAGTSKHEGEAGCHSITARQDSDGKKNSRDELAKAEQDRDSKRQRSNGAPGEATLVMSGYSAVENLSAKPSGGEAAAL